MEVCAHHRHGGELPGDHRQPSCSVPPMVHPAQGYGARAHLQDEELRNTLHSRYLSPSLSSRNKVRGCELFE
ncbi:UNVERIFIED_CONTAM: hypothetical protein NCL1_44945 [Trichonephila clavipes]